VSDLTCAVLALALTVSVLGGEALAPGALALVLLMPVAIKALGLYDRDEHRLRQTTLEEAPALFQLAAMFGLVAWLGGDAVVDGHLSRDQAVLLGGMLAVSLLVGRKTTRRVVRALVPGERCLVLGDAAAAERTARSFETTHRVTARIVGRVPLEPGETHFGDVRVLGSLRALGSVLERHAIDRVLIAPRRSDSDQILDAVRLGKSLGVKVSVLPHLLEVVGSVIRFDDIEGLTLLQVPRHRLAHSSALLKRAVDLTLALGALVLLAPLLAMIAVAVKIGSGGPVLVREPRLRKRGEPFDMLRFATATPGTHEAWRGGRERRTRVGRLIRRASLEELPQLLNVVQGEMSLVGPRAPMADEQDFAAQLDLAPGVTGLWRIFGSTRLSAEEIAKIEYTYGATWSLWLDARILIRTIPAIIRQRDGATGLRARVASAVGEAPRRRRVLVEPDPRPSAEGLVVTEQPPPAADAVFDAEQVRRERPAMSDRGREAMAALDTLSLTAIVPATNSPPTLSRCTQAIHEAQASSDELIVVEHSPSVGPADARNHAARSASGDILVFVDSDVVVEPGAFRHIRAAFEADAELTALFGAYDEGLPSLGTVAIFRNALHHHVHKCSAGPVSSFWSGLGAIRKDAFLAAGGFDADRFRRAAIEDVELGMRLSADGAKIVLDPKVRGTHLKDWGFREMVHTDFAKRGVPWMSLLLRNRERPRAVLNLGWRHRWSAAASLATVGAALSRRPLMASGSLLAFLGLNHRFYALLARHHGPRTAAAGLPLHLVHHLVSVAAVPGGIAAHLADGRRARRRSGRDAARPPDRATGQPPPRVEDPGLGRAHQPEAGGYGHRMTLLRDRD